MRLHKLCVFDGVITEVSVALNAVVNSTFPPARNKNARGVQESLTEYAVDFCFLFQINKQNDINCASSLRFIKCDV